MATHDLPAEYSTMAIEWQERELENSYRSKQRQEFQSRCQIALGVRIMILSSLAVPRLVRRVQCSFWLWFEFFFFLVWIEF